MSDSTKRKIPILEAMEKLQPSELAAGSVVCARCGARPASQGRTLEFSGSAEGLICERCWRAKAILEDLDD